MVNGVGCVGSEVRSKKYLVSSTRSLLSSSTAHQFKLGAAQYDALLYLPSGFFSFFLAKLYSCKTHRKGLHGEGLPRIRDALPPKPVHAPSKLHGAAESIVDDFGPCPSPTAVSSLTDAPGEWFDQQILTSSVIIRTRMAGPAAVPYASVPALLLGMTSRCYMFISP